MKKILCKKSEKLLWTYKTAEVLRDDVYVQIPLEQVKVGGIHSPDQVKTSLWDCTEGETSIDESPVTVSTSR